MMISPLTVNYVQAALESDHCVSSESGKNYSTKIKVYHGKWVEELHNPNFAGIDVKKHAGERNHCLFPWEIPQLNISKSDYDSGSYDLNLPEQCGITVQKNFSNEHVCKPKPISTISEINPKQNPSSSHVDDIRNDSAEKSPFEEIGYYAFAILIIVIGVLARIGKISSNGITDYVKKTRRGWSKKQKAQIRKRQNGKCNRCRCYPQNWEYHHRDGDRSNNDLNNAEALCLDCHRDETNSNRY